MSLRSRINLAIILSRIRLMPIISIGAEMGSGIRAASKIACFSVGSQTTFEEAG